MNTEQLQRVIQCDTYMKNRIIGVFSADQLPHMQLGSETGLITNTDPTHLPGRHWVAFYLNQQKELECFDSFGNSPAVNSTFLAQFIKGYSKIDIIPKCLQSIKCVDVEDFLPNIFIICSMIEQIPMMLLYMISLKKVLVVAYIIVIAVNVVFLKKNFVKIIFKRLFLFSCTFCKNLSKMNDLWW